MKAKELQRQFLHDVCLDITDIGENNDILSPSNYNLITECVDMLADNYKLNEDLRSDLQHALFIIYHITSKLKD